MRAYLLKRLLWIVPTLLGILLLNFIIVQAAPGGPVERTLAMLKPSGGGELMATQVYRGSQGVDPELIAQLNQQFGFDKPAWQRFGLMLGQYLTFDLGQSFYRDISVWQLICEKMPVSISLGLWTTLLMYGIAIPLGIRKAVRNGSAFDTYSSLLVFIGHAIPSFLFAILLIVLFAGGSFWQWFPLRGLTSDHWHSLSIGQQILDYLWHLVLPITALVLGSFAGLTMLTKNAFLDQIHQQYVLTARAKGASESRVLYGHIFRNAMLIVIAGFPAALFGVLFSGSLLIEMIFSLDGLGLLGYQAVLNRDYPVVFGTLYFFTLLGLLLNLLSDLLYVWIDPRIDFARREG